MPFTEPLADLFRTEDFATAAVWSVGAAAVEIILDNEYAEGFGAESSQPVAAVRSAQMPTAAQGQTLTVGATVYRIVGVEPDGLGMTLLRLARN